MTALPLTLKEMRAPDRAQRCACLVPSVCRRLLALGMLAALVAGGSIAAHAAEPVKGEIRVVTDGGYARLVFRFEEAIDAKVRDKVLAKGDPKARLRELQAALAGFDFTADTAIEQGIKDLAAKGGFGFGDYQAVARLALSGTNVGPSITGMMRILGRERVSARFQRLLEQAG